MGHFSREDEKKKENIYNLNYQNYDREDITQNRKEEKKFSDEKLKAKLIQSICLMDSTQTKEELEIYSLKKLELLKKRLDKIEEKKYLIRYGTSKVKTYESPKKFQESFEETNGLGR